MDFIAKITVIYNSRKIKGLESLVFSVVCGKMFTL